MRYTATIITGCLLGASACTPLVLAPGAEQVKMTRTAADVAGCAPVGNLRVPENANGMLDVARAVSLMKNQTIGFGGGVAFVTEGSLRAPTAGVAYKCPASSR